MKFGHGGLNHLVQGIFLPSPAAETFFKKLRTASPLRKAITECELTTPGFSHLPLTVGGFFKRQDDSNALLGTFAIHIFSTPKAFLKMMFFFNLGYFLVPWRVFCHNTLLATTCVCDLGIGDGEISRDPFIYSWHHTFCGFLKTR